jgi:hypothetical protein
MRLTVFLSRASCLTILLVIALPFSGSSATLLHRYSFTADASDSIGGANGVLFGNAAILNKALALDGASSYVDLPDDLVSGLSSVTFEAWVTDNGSGSWSRVFDFGNDTTRYMFLAVDGSGGMRACYTISGSVAEQRVIWSTKPATGARTHIVLTTDSGTQIGSLYVNGALVASSPGITLTPSDISPTSNDWLGRSQFGGDPYWTGEIDEFRIYAGALSANEVTTNYLAGPDKILSGPVIFVSQPQNRTNVEGTIASFNADVDGAPPFSLQWYRNSAILPGATNSTLTFTAAVSNNNNTYQLWATNVVNGVTYTASSTTATLTVFSDTNPPVLLNAQSISTNGANLFFSESLRVDTATNKANYSLTGPGGSVTINNAALDVSGTKVTLTTAPLLIGSNYTVTVTGVRDLTGNLIAPGSQANFVATTFTLQDIGSPAQAGYFQTISNGLSLVAGGTGIGKLSDQFSFAFETRTGDFDVQLRLGSLGLSDPWAMAGLMARDGTTTNAAFAASFATPGPVGSFFQSRTNSGSAATQAGFFPVNYPDTWLRLKRVGNVFTGYASLDARSWTTLGSVTFTASSLLQVGIAVSSHSAAQTTSAAFSAFGNTTNGTVGNTPLPFEPLGPSSRRTGLVISEIMYHPQNVTTNSLEFVELYNSDLISEDISGYRLSGSIDYTFPAGTILPSGGFLVVARVPSAVQSYYGISGVLGPFTNNLPNGSGTVRLRNELDGVLLEVNYESKAPWPVSPDGAGHSLVLRRPSYGENDPRAWAASDLVGGSPGRADGYSNEPLRGVVINEILAHTDLPELDSIELFNPGTQSVNLNGCILTDDPDTNRYVIGSVTIPARGFVYFTETQLGYRLDAAGETLYLKNPAQTRVIDSVRFDEQENGVSIGRYPNGSDDWYRMSSKTFGTANSSPSNSAVVLNEIMYSPLSGDDGLQYVELYNRGPGAVNLGGWKLRDGITFSFTSNTIVAAGGYIVVANNLSDLLTNYPNLNTNNTVGNFGGNLSHRGERITLTKPVPHHIEDTNGVVIATNTLNIVVDEVTYGDGGRWGQWSDGGGSSLELIDARSDRRKASNWADSDETSKAPWTLIERTDVATLGFGTTGNGAPNRFEFFLQGQGECLVDEMECRSNGGTNRITNPGFESGATAWAFQGTHNKSSVEAGGAFSGSQALHVRAVERGDTGANRIRTAIALLPVNGTNQITLRARARWLRGDPNILLRTRGNWLECAGAMTVPKNLGTPGAANSRAVANAGPAISDVSHFPVLPADSEPVVVSALVSDPDGVAGVTLQYRIDPNTTYSSIVMRDNGTGGDAFAGDGIYSATIPGQPANTMVAFYIQASDSFASPATTFFPATIPTNECLINFGETLRSTSIGAYRLWLTQSNINYWTTREKNSNEPLDATFVYGNWRVVYNMKALYSGSPFHTPNYNGPLWANGTVGSPANVCNYIMNFPSDDLFLGSGDFTLQGQATTESSTFNNDLTTQAENTAHWMAHKIGLAPDYRRYIFVGMNGQTRGMIYYDGQQPNSDIVTEYYPDDDKGHLHKIEDWFEFDDAGSGQSIVTATLQDFSVNGQKRTEHYRWNFRPRAVKGSPNEFQDLFTLVDAVNSTSPEPYTSATLNLMDVRQWTRVFALEHMAGNWDSYGYERGKNMYTYKPENGHWRLLLWDVQLIFGKSSRTTTDPLFNINDPLITKLVTHPPFAREYWGALNELATGPMMPSAYYPLMDARYAALLANSVPVQNPSTIKGWVDARRSYIVSQIPQSPFTLGGPLSFSSSSNSVVISGTAPVNVGGIFVNGGLYPITWTTVTHWSIRVTLTSAGLNTLVVQAIDRNGNVMPGLSGTVNVTYTGGIVLPEGNVVFNEIMSRPVLPGAEYIELFNTHSNYTFDLSNWRLNGVDYLFPPGSILAPRSFLVLTKNRYDFTLTYGSTNAAFDEFDGGLDADGETLTLFRPGSGTNEIVVDRIRYEAAPPWPVTVKGASLQLIDAAQDNSRVANWGVRTNVISIPPPIDLLPLAASWRYMQTTNLDGVAWISLNAKDSTWPTGNGLLAFENNSAITPLIQTTLTDPRIGSAFVNPGHAYYFRTKIVVSNDISAYQVNASAYIDDGAVFYINGTEIIPRIRMNGGTVTNMTLANGTPPGGDATTPDTFTIPGALFIVGTNVIAVEVHQSATNSSDIVFGLQLQAVFADSGNQAFCTPGAANSIATVLPPFPPLWLNEAQANNVTGPIDNFGQHDSWAEIFNDSNTNVSLLNCFLTDNYTNLAKWAFPFGPTVSSNGFTMFWCDNQTNQTAGNSLHAGLTLASGSGSLVLTRIINGATQIVDYLNYTNLPSNWSYGDVPDGQPFYRREMFYVTPGSTNNGASAPLTVFINEWMADNTSTLADPADGDYEDWFELYNPGANTVDLGGYFLTDNLTNKFQFQIPNNGHYLIPANGYLLVWADNESGQNSTNRADLHVNFALGKGGEVIGLFAADGTTIDAVTFGAQTSDITEGRYPNGGANIYSMPIPTPRAPNLVPNTAPSLALITNRVVTLGQTLSFTASATDTDLPPQTLTFSLSNAPAGAQIGSSSGAFTWTPSAAPATDTIGVVVTDNGTPNLSASRSFTVVVAPQPVIGGIFINATQFVFNWSSFVGQKFQVQVKTNLGDAAWSAIGGVLTGNGGVLSFTNFLDNTPQRFFRVQVLP